MPSQPLEYETVEAIPDDQIESPNHEALLEAIITAVENGERLVFIDLFCGGGGFSTGLALALEDLADVLGCDPSDFAELHAVNHDPVAIETHKSAHPWATHYELPIQQIEPQDVVDRETTVHLLIAAPDCTDFSGAKGGGPKDPDARIRPFDVLTWVEELQIQNFLFENVPGFRKWGPLNDDNKPIPEKRGDYWDAWINTLSIEFNVEHRVLCCADYGDATSRERLFVMGRKNGGVSWPERTHTETGKNGTEQWRSAADIIDWSDPGESLWIRDLLDGRRNVLVFFFLV